MNTPLIKHPSSITIGIALFLGVAARLLLPWAGHNYDIDSWEIVANIVREGKNVFAFTDRHNYGPGLFSIFAFAKDVSLMFPIKHPETFHFVISLILTLADLGIFWLLAKRVSSVAATLFILSPISILITGYHSQVDNIAIFLGFAAWLVFESENRDLKKIIASAFLLGISLTVKHDLLLLPIWFLFDPRWKSKSEKALYLFIAFSLFFGSFIPFANSPEAQQRILKNVFQYTSGSSNSLMPHLVQALFPISLFIPKLDSALKLIFILSMVLMGKFVMKREPFHAFYIYLVCLVLFSAQMADQYLAIPVLACAVFSKNRWLLAYTAVGTLFLLGSPFNLYLWPKLTGYAFLGSVYAGGLWWFYHTQIWLLFFLGFRYFQVRQKVNCESSLKNLY